VTTGRTSEGVVERAAEILFDRIGLRPDPTMRGRLRRAVSDDMIELGQDPGTYLDALAAGGDALQGLLNRITVQETAFFRHPEHFEVLASHVLPTLPRPVKIWSAGCANGQEAFSLAMLLDELDVEGSVIATDVSTTALQRTESARYLGREISGLSPGRIARYLIPMANGWQVTTAIRDRVSTLRHNLVDPLPLEVRSCHVIFCRNVLIYLSAQHVRALLDRIADTFPAATAIFLGAAETIWQVSDRFRAVPVGNTFLYRQVVADQTAAKAQVQQTVSAGTARPRRTTVRARVERVTRERDRRPPPGGDARPIPLEPPSVSADALAKAADDAMAAGDYAAAVVAFRKYAYLVPDDPVAQLQLGLALEALGDEPSAQRAYAAARHALLRPDSASSTPTFEGYAAGELVSLLDWKQRRAAR
jgi:chemotaxis methyl-accepting protein methylase